MILKPCPRIQAWHERYAEVVDFLYAFNQNLKALGTGLGVDYSEVFFFQTLRQTLRNFQALQLIDPTEKPKVNTCNPL